MHPTMGIKDYDFLFKVVLVGDDGVGKTTLLRSFTESRFNTRVRPHDVADVESKTIQRRSKRVKLHVWDTAGKCVKEYRITLHDYYTIVYIYFSGIFFIVFGLILAVQLISKCRKF